MKRLKIFKVAINDRTGILVFAPHSTKARELALNTCMTRDENPSVELVGSAKLGSTEGVFAYIDQR